MSKLVNPVAGDSANLETLSPVSEDSKPRAMRFVKARKWFVYSNTAGIHTAWDVRADAVTALHDMAGYGPAPIPGAEYRVVSRETLVRMRVLTPSGVVL